MAPLKEIKKAIPPFNKIIKNTSRIPYASFTVHCPLSYLFTARDPLVSVMAPKESTWPTLVNPELEKVLKYIRRV